MTTVESTSGQTVESSTPLPHIANAVDQPEMNEQELTRLECVIERGHQTFIEVGEALLAIREHKGYGSVGFATFEAYLEERLGWSRQRGIN
jgi:hypothetical protein